MDAQQRAQSFFRSGARNAAQRGTSSTTDNLPSLAYISEQEGEVHYYVFNEASYDGGFVIIGGDESATPILGYCDHGSFDYDTAPDNVKWWLSQYDEQIHAGIEAVKADPAMAPRRGAMRSAATTRREIPALIKTKWNQDAPFNNAIPVIPGYKSFYTGCVATGMAQILNYYQYPNNGIGDHSYIAEFKSSKDDPKAINAPQPNETADFTHGFYADFESEPFDWKNMLNEYKVNNYTEAQADAVAKLMYLCGVSVDMAYGTSSSGASSADIPKALIERFGYDKSARVQYRVHFGDEDWEQMIYDELAADRPVCYSGRAGNTGHLFICDGYSASGSTAGMFRFNWGWGGYCDGEYAVSGTNALRPNGSGIGGAGGDEAYSSRQMIVIGIKHDDPSAEERPHLSQFVILGSYSGESPNYISASESKPYVFEAGTSHPLQLRIRLQNQSYTIKSFEVGIKAIDTETGLTYYWPGLTTYGPLDFGYYYTSNDRLNFNTEVLEYNGTYKILPVCRKSGAPDDAEWEEVDVEPGDVSTVTIIGGKSNTPTTVDFSVDASQVGVDRLLAIRHSPYYEGQVTYTSSNPKVATVDEKGVIRGVAPGKVTITAKASPDKIFLATTKTISIEVVKQNVLASEFTIDKTSLYVGKTAQISIPTDLVVPVSFSSSLTSVASVSSTGTITAISPGTTIITASVPATPYYPAVSQTFSITVDYMPVMFYETPYFNNGNNTYVDDYTLYLPVENKSSKYYSGYMRAWVFVSGGGYYPQYVYVRLNSGERNVYTVTNDNIQSDGWPHSSYYNYPLEVRFFMDKDATIPMNIPSITYKFRDKLTQTCTLTADGLGSLTLPFDAAVPDGWSAYSCVDGNGTLQLIKAASIERNKPYILLGPANASADFSGPKAIDDVQTFADGLLVGTVVDGSTAYQSGDYVVSSSKNVAKATIGQKAAAFSAFLRLGANFHGLTQPATIKVQDVIDIPTLTQCIMQNHQSNEISFIMPDVNGDGKVTVADLTTLIAQ